MIGKAAATLTAASLMLRSRAARPASPPRPDYELVFIGGCPRSGTTWVQDAFDQHPRVVTGHEADPWGTIHPWTGRGIRGWATLLWRDSEDRRRVRSRQLPSWIDRASFRRLVCRAMTEHGTADEVTASLISAVFDQYVAEHVPHHRPVLVEKTPADVHYAERILRFFPDARFIEVRRDGRDVLVSLKKIAARQEGFPTSRREQIRWWVDAVRAGLALQQRRDLADRVLLVRYEDQKIDPVGGIRRLWDFAGLEYDSHDLERAAAATSFDAVRQTEPTGDGMFRRKGEVGDWAGELDREEISLFRELAGDVFEAAGYTY